MYLKFIFFKLFGRCDEEKAVNNLLLIMLKKWCKPKEKLNLEEGGVTQNVIICYFQNNLIEVYYDTITFLRLVRTVFRSWTPQSQLSSWKWWHVEENLLCGCALIPHTCWDRLFTCHRYSLRLSSSSWSGTAVLLSILFCLAR